MRRLQQLYRRRVPPAQVLTPELGQAMAALSFEINRQIGLLVDRKGVVDWVVIGDANRIHLPDLGRHRAGSGRLRGVRLLHTHLDGSPLSREDLTDLSLLRLDLVAALEVREDGQGGSVYVAYPVAENQAGQLWDVLPPMDLHRVEVNPLEVVRAVEEEWARVEGGQEASRGERAILVHVAERGTEAVDPEDSLMELTELADSANLVVIDAVIQHRQRLDPRTLMGRGKLEELMLRSLQLGADVIIFDRELAPAQIRAIAERTDLKIVDRSQLILDIFAQRAKTGAGKLQVELAQLRYTLPRLTGRGTAMSRLMGGIGGRGPGEQRLEIERRRVRERIHRLEGEIDRLATTREQLRSRRTRRGVPIVSIVGYTNAGKSTLLNTLTHSKVYVEDRLFATLDPTSRRLRFPQDREVILTDTVGFIRDLPPELVNAFRATLEELSHADLLLHVVDASDPRLEDRIGAVNAILEDLQLGQTPRILVLNKIDLLPEGAENLAAFYGAIPIQATLPESTRPLLAAMERILWSQQRARQSHDEE